MIRNRAPVKRYAEAFYGFASESIGAEKALLDLSGVGDIMRDNPGLMELLMAPGVGLSDKERVINAALTDGFSDEIRHFLVMLTDKKRIDCFQDIAEFIRIKYSHGGEEEALLVTACIPDREVIAKIKEKLEDRFKKKFKIYIEPDASLLGGMQIIIGNTVIDGSVRRRLDELKEKLMTVRVT